jgi:alanine dehydrogenase
MGIFPCWQRQPDCGPHDRLDRSAVTSNNRGWPWHLLGGVPGVPPAVIILGAGIVGTNAARMFKAAGAHVTVLDADVRRLQSWRSASMWIQ